MINKYKELHERLLDKFVEYHNIHTMWVLRFSQEKTIALRKTLSEMRELEFELRAVAKEIQRETSKAKRIKWNREQGDSDECNNSSN